jgi:Ca2+-transporting ATPase
METYSIPGFADPVSSLMHLLAAGVFTVLGFFLIRRAKGKLSHVLSVSVFVFTCIFLLSMSGVFHLLSVGGAGRAVLQRLDHAAIFSLIAGSFTPVHSILFTGFWRWGVLLLVWSLAITGLTLKVIFFEDIPESLGLTLYLGLGWLGLVSGIAVWRRFGFSFFRPMLFSALAYTSGAVLDFFRWPVLIGGVLGPHELFHIAVLAGIGFHWRFVRNCLDRADAGAVSAKEPEQPSAWHSKTIEQTFEAVRSGSEGLTEEEAGHRLAKYGFNEIEQGRSVSALWLFLSQFKSVLVIILLVAIGLSAYLGHTVESIVIAVIVLFAVFLGFFQEYRAERAMEALQQMAAPTASVLRGGKFVEIPARYLVPGDIVRLQTGNRIPADLRLIESVNLQIDEAPLTGESTPVEKRTAALDDPQLAIGDRSNMGFAGTAVTYGRGQGVVVATGMETEFGRIVGLLRGAEQRETPLQKSLDKVGNVLAIAAVLIVSVIVSLGILQGESFEKMLIFGIALAVAVVPEALPAVVTISLAIGARRMVRRHALIRRLPAVETLGSTSVICSDKTGTLTKDEMTVRKIWAAGDLLSVTGAGYEPVGRFLQKACEVAPPPAITALLQAAALASDAGVVRTEDGRWGVQGDPTEGALVVAAAKAGLKPSELARRFPRVGEIPFTSESKRMTTLHESADGGRIAYAKGALEVILNACNRWVSAEGEVPLDDAARKAILAEAERMAGEALRVLAVARKEQASLETAEHDMCFLGLVGMIDPPRPESKSAIATCEKAGIKVVMITGDHPVTARSVARELGILKDGRVATGVELDAMSDEELARTVKQIEVFARVAPEHKIRIVQVLQGQGHIVAMTGDGVNDAPALKQADIGVAMGITGTDVSKEAAAMMLTDDNFASIVAAVEEGRGIFSNIKKYLMYLLSSNIGEIGLMAGATLVGLPLPLSAVQILYVNLATDGLPALALAVDPMDEALMRQKPRDPKQGIFTLRVVSLMLVGGIWSTLVNLSVFVWTLRNGEELSKAMTLTFATLASIEFFKAYNFRSDHFSVFRRPFANKWLNLAIVWEAMLLLGIIYVPFFQGAFGTLGLSGIEWAVVLGASATIVPVLEAAKWVIRHGWFGSHEAGLRR